MSGASEMQVRPASDGDIADLVALWNACGLTRPWNDPERDIEAARAGATSDVLVGVSGGRLVASAMVGFDGHRGGVYYVAVSPDHQGLGLGRAMMAAIEGWMRDHGAWKINLLIRDDNAKVLEFYRSLGYEPGGTTQLGKWL